MRSEYTARLVARYRALLERALNEHNVELEKQYFKGLVLAKNEHIQALERDLMTARIQARKVAWLMYLILVDGFVIIEVPMSLDKIIETFGPIALLETKGFILKKVSKWKLHI